MISSQNLKLRVVNKSDLKLLLEWENNPIIQKHSESSNHYSEKIMLGFIESAQDIYINDQLRFMIETNTDIIGCVDLYDYDSFNLKAGVGILIDEKYRNKTYAKQTLKILKEYAFNDLKLNQLYCKIETTNKKSIKLFSALGFKHSGILKSWLNTKNGWNDVIFMQCFD